MTLSRCNLRWNGKQSQHHIDSPMACNRGRRHPRKFRDSYVCRHCTAPQQLGARRTPLEGGLTLLGREHTAGPSIPSTECLVSGFGYLGLTPVTQELQRGIQHTIASSRLLHLQNAGQ